MFSGSSCTQKTGVPSAYGLRLAASSASSAADRAAPGAGSPRPSRPSSCARLVQFVVDLAAAQQHALAPWPAAAYADRAGCAGTPRAPGRPACDRLRMAQQALGRHHHQRLAPPAQHLPAQAVEVLRRRRRVDDLDVVCRPPAAGTVPGARWSARALPFEAVRQQQHQRRSAAATSSSALAMN